jgi:cytochrome c oxidase cbb3-type subunit 4
MSDAWGTLIGVLTVLIMLSFVGIWIWAWLQHHRRDFDRLARLPMGDDDAAKTNAVEPQ